MRFAAFLAVAAAVASAVSLFEPEVERVQYTPTLTGFFDPESSEDAPEAIALRKLAELTGAQMHWEIESSYQTQHNKLHHVYLRQQINGVPVANCEANVNVASNGAVVSMGVSAFRGEVPVVAKTVITPEQALFRVANYAELILAKDLKPFMTEVSEGHFAFEAPSLSTEPITVDAVYIKTTEETIALAWRVHMVVDGPAQEYASYVAMVDAVDPSAELIAIQDEVKWYMPKEQAEELANNYKVLSANETDNMGMGADRAQYLVYGIPAMDPNFGERVQDQGPPDAAASPMGWFNQGNGRTFTDTRGNNVFAQDNPTGGSGWQNNYRPNCGAELDCRFPINLGLQPVTYRDASILNLFWWNNVVHDIFYLRGFDEVSGNAQENNMGRGGRENDAVQANAQDGAGFNNANMMTPADGGRGRMRMYLWNGITPMRDGDLDSGIIVHEYAHHISQRLTGGPQNVGCLSGGQPGGMGEGWGDFFATLFLQRPGTTRLQEFPMGLYAARRGIRPFPYTTSRATNPQTFGILNTGAPYNAVHAIGSVWCQILFQVYWEMRDEFGFNADWWHGESGNNALLQDVTDGLKIQPCSPNFVQARDAILTADRQNYNGRHLCALWRGFAFRGLGVGAASRSTNSVTESFEVPLECQM